MSVLQNRLLCITHKLVNIHYKLTAIIPQIKNIACIYAKIAKPGDNVHVHCRCTSGFVSVLMWLASRQKISINIIIIITYNSLIYNYLLIS